MLLLAGSQIQGLAQRRSAHQRRAAAADENSKNDQKFARKSPAPERPVKSGASPAGHAIFTQDFHGEKRGASDEDESKRPQKREDPENRQQLFHHHKNTPLQST